MRDDHGNTSFSRKGAKLAKKSKTFFRYNLLFNAVLCAFASFA